jgi:hypothetical protein
MCYTHVEVSLHRSLVVTLSVWGGVDQNASPLSAGLAIVGDRLIRLMMLLEKVQEM